MGMTSEEKMRILKEFKVSKGWLLLKQLMEEAIMAAAMDMAEGKPMPEEQYNFTRGAMWAAKRHLTLPDELIKQLENELLMSTDSATAEQQAKKVSLRLDEKGETK
jgi:hypothetical protein